VQALAAATAKVELKPPSGAPILLGFARDGTPLCALRKACAVTESSVHELRRNLWWIRPPDNPVLPPGPPGSFDCGCCMNPWALRVRDQWRLYYAGADADGRRRICLATSPVGDGGRWHRRGPVLEPGPEGSFDARWCVLPHVVQFAPDRWHLYYTGNCGRGRGLAAFPGIGLAVSRDLVHWEKYEGNPVLPASGRTGDPDAVGVAGGSVLKARLPDGSTEWRFYYTGCPTVGDDVFLDQQKTVCLAVSRDGLAWERRGAVMLRDPDRDYENVAVAGPVVHQDEDGSYRMWFSAIGTRWGYYSIGYAESEDGLAWRRGHHYGDDLQLAPAGDGWERQMVEYPSVVRDAGRLRLFYCGNGYGATGIGTAVASALRAAPRRGMCHVRITAAEVPAAWDLRVPEGLSCDEGAFKLHHWPEVDWHGPDDQGRIWHEWQTNDEDFAVISSWDRAEEFGIRFIQGVHYRVIIGHVEHGLALRVTVRNLSERTLHNVVAFPCLGHPTPNFRDEAMERTFIVTAAGLTALADTDRGTGDPIRTHYIVEGMRPMRFVGVPFWGEPSATRAAAGAILRTSACGRFTVGTSWEAVCELFHNEDAHHCIHSVPTLGDIEPGDTRTVRGRIVLVEGGPPAALDLLSAPC
jgi:predicted GH43/DUF377 family glycosyl hydrolase